MGAIHALFQCFFSLSISYVSIRTFVSFPSKCPTKRTSLFKISQSLKAFSALRARYRLHRQPYSYMIIYIFSNPLLYLPFAKFTHPTSALTCSVSSSPPCSYHSFHKFIKIIKWLFAHDNLNEGVFFQRFQSLRDFSGCILQIFSDRRLIISINQ